jgi:hypothetical protein
MKKAYFLILVLALAGCNRMETQDSRDSAIVDNQQAQYAKVQPIPYFDFSMDRDTLIQIYKAKNEARKTWSVVTSQGTGAILFICDSIGFAIPSDTQLTNGSVPSGRYLKGEGTAWVWVDGVVEQPEPNGLYSSKNTDGTYVQCVGDDGSVSPVYTEQKVTTFPFPVVEQGGRIVRAAGESTITLDIKSGEVGTAPEPSVAP